MSRHLALVLAAAVVLAGCAGPAPLTARIQSAKGLAAKGQVDDVLARVDSEAKRAIDKVGFNGGVAAAMEAPTDVFMQRGMITWFARATQAMESFIGPDFDERVGDLVTQEYIAEHPEFPKAEVKDYIQKVADRLTAASKLGRYKTYVATEDTVNAMNAGGHFLVVHTALISQVGDEAELAGVIAHEITHGERRHMLKGVSRMAFDQNAVAYCDEKLNVTAEQLALAEGHFRIMQPNVLLDRDKDFVLSYLSGKVLPETMRALVFRYNSYFADRTMDRDAELEADAGAARLLAAAGYDPEGLTRVIDRWNDHLTADVRYHGHPAAGERVGGIRQTIAQGKLTGTDKGADRLAAIKPLLGKTAVATVEQAREEATSRHSLGANPWLRSRKK